MKKDNRNWLQRFVKRARVRRVCGNCNKVAIEAVLSPHAKEPLGELIRATGMTVVRIKEEIRTAGWWCRRCFSRRNMPEVVRDWDAPPGPVTAPRIDDLPGKYDQHVLESQAELHRLRAEYVKENPFPVIEDDQDELERLRELYADSGTWFTLKESQKD